MFFSPVTLKMLGPDLHFLGSLKLLAEGSQQEACELPSSGTGEMREGRLN